MLFFNKSLHLINIETLLKVMNQKIAINYNSSLPPKLRDGK